MAYAPTEGNGESSSNRSITDDKRNGRNYQIFQIDQDADIAIYPYQTFCTSKYENLWTGLLYGYKGFLLLFCTYLAWETRKVHMPALNDSKQIGFAVYNVFIPCVIIIPILNLLGSHSDAVYLLSTLLCLFCTTITQCLIFVPKVSTRSYILLAIEGRRQNHNCKKIFQL